MPSTHSQKLRDAVIAVGLLLASAFTVQLEMDENIPYADEVQYLAMAHNLFHHGVLSLTTEPSEQRRPTALREPAYPVFLAGLMFFDDRLASGAIECVSKRASCVEAFNAAKQANLLLYLLAGTLIWLIAREISRRPWMAHVALFLFLANLELHEYATYLISDFLALLLTVVASCLVYLSFVRPRPLYALGCGASIAFLVLTKAAFLLLGPLLVVGYAAAALRATDEKRQRLLASVCLFVLSYGILIGGWGIRNWISLDRLMVTQRGGQVLAHRVELNGMTGSEYAVSFLWWTRGFGDNLARRLVDPIYYTRFELRDPNGFYNAAQTKWIDAVALKVASGSEQLEAEKAVGREMRDQVVLHWFKNLLVSIPVGYRGLFIDEFIVLTFPSACLLIFSRRRRVPGFLWFATPGIFAIAFHAGLTLNLPRHAIPLLPALAIAGSYGILWIRNWGKEHLRRWHGAVRQSQIR